MTRHSTSVLGFILALAAATSVPAGAQLFGVSQKDELAAGKQADAQIQQKYRISSDAYLNGLVQHLGSRLVRVCERPNISWTFRVLDSQELNAFSVPGYVYVNTALIDAVHGDQDQLACVIAHEIGHTCGRHAAHQMEQSSEYGLLAGLLGGKKYSGIANLAANMVLLGHSRSDENDADKRGVRYAMRAGYDPYALIRFFQMLEQKMGSGGGGLTTYFQTHPPTPDRIKRVQQDINQQGGPSSSSVAAKRGRTPVRGIPNGSTR